ncbi:MAG: TRAP transporter large permease [Dehalococcoidales bacterium]|nr:TRAP transporter large permease [Dehalococcoidales bacterium]
MSLEWIGALGILAFIILIFLEIPVGICMGLLGFVGLGIIRGWDSGLSVLGLQYFRTAATYAFSVIPLFVLMGFLATEVRISSDAFIVIKNWLGHFRGGLAMATSIACAIFAAICGDSIATASTLAAVSLPEMRKLKYDDRLSLGVLASSGNLGFLIPPSLGFVFYAIITEQSIGNLFMAGICPGVLLSVLFIITIAIWCRINPSLGPATAPVGWNTRFTSLRYVIAPAVVIIFVLGGIYTGIITPIEAAAAGTFLIYIIGIILRRLTKKAFTSSLYETGKLVGRIFILVSGALVFSRFITISELPAHLANLVSTLNLSPMVVLWIILVFYILIGFLLDIMSIILLVAPVLHFVLVGMGFDPVYLGAITMITILMGQISPPFGIVVFGLKAYVTDVPIWTIYKGCIPFLAVMLVGLILCVYFPQIELFLVPRY